MIAVPSVDVLRARAEQRVEEMAPIVAGGASLLALQITGIQRFIFHVPTEKASLHVKARSFLVSLLPKVLCWRARRVADLGPEHEVLVAAGKAMLVVPSHALARVEEALRADARSLHTATDDDLWIDVAAQAVSPDAFEVANERSFTSAWDGAFRALGRAWCRRADKQPPELWDPQDPMSTEALSEALAELGRLLRTSGERVSALQITDASAKSALPLQLAIDAGPSISSLPKRLEPRLVLRTDGQAPELGGLPNTESAAFPLAGTWIQRSHDGEGVMDFGGLAEGAEGDKKLGVLRMDIDALGRAFQTVSTGKGPREALRDRLALSEAVSLVCGPVADAVTWKDGQPRNLQWILAGGDDLFLVGGWSQIVDVAAHLRNAIVPGVKNIVAGLAGPDAAKDVDLSGGIVIAPAGVPLAHLAEQAEEQVEHAKGQRMARSQAMLEKKAICLGDVPVGWGDWSVLVDVAEETVIAIEQHTVSRGVLRRLSGIHELWWRAEEALRKGLGQSAAEAEKRRWLWGYSLLRQASSTGEEGKRLVERLRDLALSDMDTPRKRPTEQHAAAWMGLVAEIAHRKTRSSREERR